MNPGRPFQCHEETEVAMKAIEVMLSECERDEAIVELQGFIRWLSNRLTELVKAKELEHAV